MELEILLRMKKKDGRAQNAAVLCVYTKEFAFSVKHTKLTKIKNTQT